jgi:hypothetical protein
LKLASIKRVEGPGIDSTMLLIQINGTLGGLISDNVAMSQILGNDARSRLLLLSNLIAIALSLCSIVTSVILVGASCAGDLDMSGAKLGVVEEESSLGRGLLFECYGGILGLTSGLDFDAGDLATMRGRRVSQFD